MQETKVLSNRISQKQIEFLMDVHETFILGQPPKTLCMSRSATGLVNRRLLSIIPYRREGKEIMIYTITESGKKFLASL